MSWWGKSSHHRSNPTRAADNFPGFHRSKYMTCVATMAPQKLRKLATPTTAVVVPARLTMLPMHMERMNWARKTMLLTMATSVPKPRSWVASFASPVSVTSNSNQRMQDINNFDDRKRNIIKQNIVASQSLHCRFYCWGTQAGTSTIGNKRSFITCVKGESCGTVRVCTSAIVCVLDK